ncbi:serine hydrolase-domain-containing protein [Leucosporidium creatinivorum]|uniref:Serine hydrolase-domain-containing protein n=1 Tax=Leucosporidium creatinivorum TaxID=106004 RepID=A0A1Y2F8G2_9BASI|nr:serine hydrolase-domain-containing protein [Leucosporidium creatinivorum]
MDKMERTRILVLPGVAQNASLFSGKLKTFCESLEDVAEFVFVDPTHHILVPTVNKPFEITRTTDDEPSTIDPKYAPRAWWFGESQTGFYDCKGLDASVARLRMILETQGPFDAIWGFSQGAATASLIVGLLEGPHRHPVFAAPAREGYSWPPPPFKFAIFNSGFFPKDPRVRAVSGIQTPSLHVLGRGDAVVADHESESLIVACHNPRVEFHDGGHHPPTKASWALFFRDYITSFGPGGEQGGPSVVLSPKVSPRDTLKLRSPSYFSLGGKVPKLRSLSASSGEATNDGVST